MKIMNKNPQKKTSSVYTFKDAAGKPMPTETEITTITTVSTTHLFKK